MAPFLLAWLLSACSSAPERPIPPMGPPLPFEQTGAGLTHQLDRMPARLSLSPGNLPEASDALGRFQITGLVADDLAQRADSCYRAPLPFKVSQPQAFRHAPLGMRLWVEAQEIPFEPRPHAPRSTPSWSIGAGDLHLRWPGDAPPTGVTVTHEGLSRRMARIEPSLTELAAEDYVRHSVAFEDHSREGLLLPAPTTAEWDLTIPAGARFETWLAMAPTPLQGAGSDGATFVLSIVEQGRETIVARREIGAKPGLWRRLSSSTPDFGLFEADLSAWSGRAVTLRMRTEPGRTVDYDYVFAGSPVVVGAPTGPVRRVVVIALDTTRPDHLGTHGYARDTSPELDRLADSAAVFERAWAPAPRTRPSFRSATTGRHPLEAVGAQNIGEVFDRHGFATAGIVANVHLNARFDFDHGFDAWSLDTQARADKQVDRAIAWLQQNRDRDSYLFLHIMDPHLFYSAPAPYGTRYLDDPDPTLPEVFNRWQVTQWGEDELTEQRKAHIRGMYDGEIAYTSAQIGRFIEALDAIDGGNSLVVLHTDHGEELWDHGGFEHNHTLYDEVVRAALWVRPPEPRPAPLRISTPATLADIAPTLFDYAGFTDAPPSDGLSLRPLAQGDPPPAGFDRPIGVGHLMYDAERWGVVVDGHKYLVVTATGAEELYDLEADPAEQQNLAAAGDNTRFWPALALAHRMPVGPGWRIELGMRNTRLELRLPQPCLAAGVIDPEAAIPYRANIEWGEQPSAVPDDVAKLHLSEDRRTLSIERGPLARGRLYVLFAEPTEPRFEIVRDRKTVGTITPESTDWRSRGDTIAVTAGVVLVPPATEAARMGLVDGEAGDDDLSLLEALGYIGGGD